MDLVGLTNGVNNTDHFVVVEKNAQLTSYPA